MPRPRKNKVSDKEITEQHIEKLNEDHSKELEVAREKINEMSIVIAENAQLIAHQASLLDKTISIEIHKEQINKRTEACLRLQETNRELGNENFELRTKVDRLTDTVKSSEALYATAKAERDTHVELLLKADKKVETYGLAFFLTAAIVVAETLHIIFR